VSTLRGAGGTGVCDSVGAAFALADPVLRRGSASSKFRLDFDAGELYLFQLGVPADLPLGSSDIDSADGKRCALRWDLGGVRAGGACEGVEADEH
jgi:hypothetical protein